MSRIIRLDRLLSNMGYSTRSQSKRYLQRNEVEVDGNRIKNGATKVEPSKVTINKKALPFIPPVTLMMHKPADYVCSRARDFPQAKILFDLLPQEFWKLNNPVLSIAGRLDMPVTGITLLSQDGKLVSKVISPSEDAIPKQYIVTTTHPIRGDEKEIVESGHFYLRNDGKALKPVRWEQLGTHQVRITLWEGRYHQLVRMIAALGNRAQAIHRESIGPLTLGNLQEGEWRILNSEECESIRNWKPSLPEHFSPTPLPMPEPEELSDDDLPF